MIALPQAERSVADTDAGRVDGSPATDLLKVQARVVWVGAPLPERSGCSLPDSLGELGKRLAELSRDA